MIVYNSLKEIRNGNIRIPKGSTCELYWDVRGNCTLLYEQHKLPILNEELYKYFDRFTSPPSIEELTMWSEDGGCESITGTWTEVDGFGEYGDPSWAKVIFAI